MARRRARGWSGVAAERPRRRAVRAAVRAGDRRAVAARPPRRHRPGRRRPLRAVTAPGAGCVGRMPVGRVLGDHDARARRAAPRGRRPGGPIDLVGVHLTSRLPYGPPTPAAPAPRAAAAADARPTIVAGDCNFWGPGVIGVPPRLAARGARSHLARPHAPQPDRPHPAARRRRRRGSQVLDRRGAARLRLRPPTGARHPRGAVDRHSHEQQHGPRCGVAREGRAGRGDRGRGPRARPGRGAGHGAGVRRVPHRPALPRGRDQRRVPVPARPRGRRESWSRSGPTCATSRPATS